MRIKKTIIRLANIHEKCNHITTSEVYEYTKDNLIILIGDYSFDCL